MMECNLFTCFTKKKDGVKTMSFVYKGFHEEHDYS
jgi:hypothetical protein